MLSLYDDTPVESLGEDLKKKMLFGNITEQDLEILGESTGTELAKLAASYSDGIIFGSDNIDGGLEEFCRKSGVPVLDYNAEAISNGSYIEDYNSFYDQL